MLSSLSVLNNPSNSLKKLSRKQKRRRARSSSVLTSASTETSRADQELETAKAAAIKLLDQSDDHQLIEDVFLSPPKPKRARFEDITTIMEENEHESIPSNPSDLKQVKKNLVGREKNKQANLIPSQPSSPSPPILTTTSKEPPMNLSQSNPASSSKVQVEDFFMVSREEIFNDNAIVDAFQAAMDEFQFSRRESNGASNSICLPQSRSEQRRISPLYYGRPPTCPAVKTKKPPLQMIFLPRVVIPPSTTEKQNVTENSVPTRQPSPVVSELDMDEYWDLVGGRPDSESSENTEEISRDMESATQESIPVTQDGDRSCSDMSSGSSSRSSNSNELQSDSINTTTTNPTPLLSPKPPIGTLTADILTESQKLLLSNALSAQYWAGYHTALFNHSIGMSANPPQIPTSSPSTTLSQSTPHLPQPNSKSAYQLPQ